MANHTRFVHYSILWACPILTTYNLFMMTLKTSNIVSAVALWLLAANAQNPGTVTPEVHPILRTAKCTTHGGCVTQNTAVVLDYNYRWIHTAAGYDSCTTSTGLNASLCPDEATCAQNCVVEGADYASAGVVTSGSSMTMNQFHNSSTGVSSVSPRVYLLDEDTQDYVMFKLLGQELTFDVDLSTLPCGVSSTRSITFYCKDLTLLTEYVGEWGSVSV